jgi:FkbM family methyltransferase
MQQFCRKLWNTSLSSLTRGPRLRYHNWRAKPVWHAVKSGPIATAQLFLPRPDGGALKEMVEGTFDLFFYEGLRKHRDLKGAVCWDIGAHIGYHSLGFAALGAEVVAFEPNEHNARLLRLHLERNANLGKHIRHLAVAVADHDGEMTFVQSSDLSGASSGSHLDAGLQPLESYTGFDPVRVPVVRMDTLIEERGERKPDIIKIDVEGCETLVLRGGHKLLTNHKPLLLIEVHHILLMFEVQDLLLQYGYEIKPLDKEHATASRCFIIAYPRAGSPMPKK